VTVALTFRDSPARGADVSAGQRALLEPLSYNGAFAPDCSGNYGCECWCPISFISSSERMTGPDAVATPSEPKTVAELRVELDEYLFGADRRSRLARRAALRSDTDRSEVNPGYPEGVWNTAKKRARSNPGVGPSDLCSLAYSAVLHAFDNGTRPEASMGQFFGFYLDRRANDLYRKSRFRDVAVAAELRELKRQAAEHRELEGQNDPLLDEEIQRLKEQVQYIPLSIDGLLESDYDDSNRDIEMKINLAVDIDGDPRFDPEAGDRARRLNLYRLCVEACADGIKELSAVLTWATLAYWPHIDVDDAPKQQAGLHADEWERWPALWFSCRDLNLFQGGPNHRQRRRRELQKISEARSRAIHLMRTSGAEL
jgi:hypothetical protein